VRVEDRARDEVNTTIYIPLLGEGTDVWRPVSAERICDEIYRVIGAPPNATEVWAFETGDAVRCRVRTFAEGERRLVAYEQVTDNTA
jgi:hypothetical protein